MAELPLSRKSDDQLRSLGKELRADAAKLANGAEPAGWDRTAVDPGFGPSLSVGSDEPGRISLAYASGDIPAANIILDLTPRQAWLVAQRLGKLAKHQGGEIDNATGK